MKMLTLLGIFIFSFSAFAMNGRTTYQAKIVKPDGYPLEAASVTFKFSVLDAAASCVLYSETYSAVDMRSTSGLISFALGNGVRDFPASGTTAVFSNVFDNSINSMPCQTPGIYNPLPTDARRIVMQFNDGNGWQTLPAMTINSVPYAMYATKSNDSRTLNGKADTAFVETSTLAALNCTATQAIKFNNATFSCIEVPASGSGGITSVTTSGSVLSTGGTASAPVISIQAATISQDGYLTSLDYAEFKAKLSASSTEIINTLGYTPVSSSTVASQIASSTLAGDVSGNPGSNTVDSVGGKSSSQISASVDDTLAATASATADTIVKRNSSGNVTVADLYASATKINYIDIYKPLTSFNIRLQAPTSLSANYVLNLPTTSGTIGQVLSTDGSGNLSWISPTTGSVVSVSATAPLASTGGSNPTISIAQANSTTDGYLSFTDWNTFNNKQQATSAAIIATLGYTPADNAASGTYAQKANNLSDLTNIPQARTNLGLGTLAVGNSIDLGSASATGIIADARLQTQSNVSSGTQYTKVTVDGKGRVTSGAQLSSSDVTTALGFTPADNAASGTYAQKANNLSDLTNIPQARTNLGLGTFATASTIDLGSASATGTLNIARLPSFIGDATIAAASNTIILSNSGVTAGTYTKVTVDTKGRVTSSSVLNSSDVTTALGYTPATSTTLAASFVQKTGDTMTGVLSLPSNGLSVGSNQLVVSSANVGIGVLNPTAALSLKAGTTTNAPLKFTSGTLLSSAQSGTVEYDGSQLYFTDGSNIRRALATNSSPGSFDNTSSISNTSGNITLSPNNITGSVIVNSSAASISSGTGALVVNGGVGIAGSVNAAGNLNLTGSATIGQSLSLSSMTSGSLLFAGASGLVSEDNSRLFWDGSNKRLGLGTNSPAQTLSVSGSSYFSGNVGVGTGAPQNTLHVVGNFRQDIDNVLNGNSIYAYSNTYYRGPTIQQNRAQGTMASPTAVLTNDYLGGFMATGYDGSVYGPLSAGIIAQSAENWTPSSHGANLNFYTIPTGSVSNGLSMIIKGGANPLVGIGTNNPIERLQVSGTAYASSFELNATNGFTGGTRTGVAAPAALTLGLYTNGAEKVRITSTGNVGVGTATPLDKLHLNSGNLRFGVPGSGGFSLDGYEGSPDAGYLRFGDGTGWKFHFGRWSETVGGVKNAGTSGVVMTINSGSGNVGVGTTSPLAPLHVANTGYIRASGSQPQLVLKDNETTNSNFGLRGDANYGYLGRWNDDGTVSAFHMAMDLSTGNVGIGTTVPTALLQVAAGTSSTASLKFTAGTLLTSPQSGTMEYDGSNYYLTDGSNVRRTIATNDSGGIQTGTSQINSTGNLVLYPNSGTSSVVVSSTVTSTSSNTGALIVKGGLGVAGNIYTSGTLVTSTIEGVNNLLTIGNDVRIGYVTPAGSSDVAGGGNKLYFSGGPAENGRDSDNSDYLYFNRYNLATDSTELRLSIGDNASGLDAFNVGYSSGTMTSVFKVQMDGLVGVGTSSPASVMHLERVDNSALRITRNGTLNVLLGDLGSTNHGQLNLYNASGTIGAFISSGQDSYLTGGKFGVGTNNPDKLLTVREDQNAATELKIQNATNGASSTARLQIVANGSALNMQANSDTFADGANLAGAATGAAIWTPSSTTGGLAVGTTSGPLRLFAGSTSNERMRIDNYTGYVGIGTTAPTQALHVYGSQTKILVEASGAGEQAQVGFSRQGTALWSIGQRNSVSQAFTIYDNQAGADRLYITGGNVGIGTTTPVGKLSIVSGGQVLHFATGGNTSGYTLNVGLNDDGINFDTTSTVRGYNFKNGNGTLATITATGSVGIGTTNPQKKFHVNNTTESAMLLTSDLTGSTSTDGLFVGVNNNGLDSTVWNFENGYLRFATNNTERVRIDPSGNVGIGTSSPSTLNGWQKVLDVHGSNHAKMVATQDSGAVSVTTGVYSHNLAGNGYGGYTQGSGGVGLIGTESNHDLGIMTNNVARISITKAGNVGIGATAPATRLEIAGRMRITDTVSSTGSDAVLELKRGANTNYVFTSNEAEGGHLNIRTDSSRHVILQNGAGTTGNVGIGTTAPSEKLHVVGNLRVQGSTDCTLGNGAGGTNCSSDARLKENIKPIPYALEKINSLKGVEFDWNQKSLSYGRHDIGVIAQDVEKVFPTAVINDQNTGFKKVDYAVLVAPLIQAFKELYKLVMGHDDRLDSQGRQIASIVESKADKAEIEDLREKSAKLEAENAAKAKEIDALKSYLCSKDPTAPICK